ncbi:hypothetical protein V6N13_127848 [Hibiscus sabdariffa]|uniref:RNase H type-1 domain-containing protein n=1 Tax=Hibiscus sabdariffa TaxID=183260 RepID=A0ABR2CFJ9_9ROSI
MCRANFSVVRPSLWSTNSQVAVIRGRERHIFIDEGMENKERNRQADALVSASLDKDRIAFACLSNPKRCPQPHTHHLPLP